MGAAAELSPRHREGRRLLHQPHGFEGQGTVRIVLDSGHPAVPHEIGRGADQFDLVLNSRDPGMLARERDHPVAAAAGLGRIPLKRLRLWRRIEVVGRI
jgi:hypothetical protein